MQTLSSNKNEKGTQAVSMMLHAETKSQPTICQTRWKSCHFVMFVAAFGQLLMNVTCCNTVATHTKKYSRVAKDIPHVSSNKHDKGRHTAQMWYCMRKRNHSQQCVKVGCKPWHFVILSIFLITCWNLVATYIYKHIRMATIVLVPGGSGGGHCSISPRGQRRCRNRRCCHR